MTTVNRPADSKIDTKSQVLSLAKGFRVLEAFDSENRELTLSQIATKTGLDPGTAFRILRTLVELQYLKEVPGAKHYYLSLKVLGLGFHAIARMNPHDSARPVLRALVGQVREAASIGVLDGADVVYVDRVHAGLARLGVEVRIGSRVPVYSSAIGQALIAHLPKAERARILNLRPRVKITPNTPTSMAQLEERLKCVRDKGYALSDQETVLGLRIIAAPILDADGLPYAAVSVASPAMSRSLQEFVSTSVEPVLAAAGELASIYRLAGDTAIAVS
ncbi:MAG: IclR family transcriptional regulator [Planctomycetota bacterium]|nr:MAG: IclR family transcriptional regulator [Planctomycetota bacterium]